MKIIFFGTPSYCVPILNELEKAFSRKKGDQVISAVVTQKPTPVGRKKVITFSPVDKWAFKKKIEILYNPRQIIEKQIPATLGVLVAYGAIIPPEVINYFPGGILNIHPSLLPKFRGASPLQATIATGQTVSGATIIRIDDKMDHGPIISQFEKEVEPSETSQSLGEKIFAESIEILISIITPYLTGKIKPKTQNEEEATYTTLLTRQSGYIKGKYIQSALGGIYKGKWEISFIKDYSEPFTPQSILNLKKALVPWPGIWTMIEIKGEEKRLKLLEIHLEEDKLILDKVQLEGKNEVTWNEFLRGYPEFKFK